MILLVPSRENLDLATILSYGLKFYQKIDSQVLYINGATTTQYFHSQRSVLQGDPIST